MLRDDDTRTHVYRAAVREEETQGLLLDKFVDSAFGGSAMKLVMQALGNRRTSPTSWPRFGACSTTSRFRQRYHSTLYDPTL